MLGDRGGELARVGGAAAVGGPEQLDADLGADPGALGQGQGGVGVQALCGVERLDPAGDLEPELRYVACVDLERRAEPGRDVLLVLVLPIECGSKSQLLGQGVAAGAEQVAHLVGGDLVPRRQAVEAGKTRADPLARLLALGRVVRGEAGVPLLGDVLGRDLAGQVVVPAPRRQLVDRHGHDCRRRRARPRRSVVEESSSRNA